VLIFDEIQCGVGRCGAFSAAEAFDVVPDVLTFAKGLASGLPIGAMVATPAVTAGLKIGDLGSTFGGGPVPCAAAIATIEVIRRGRSIENAVMVGEQIRRAAERLPNVLEVSGRGLLLGLRLARPAAEVQRALFAARVLTGTSSDPAVLRVMPPLSFSRSEATQLVDALRRVLT
jgi:acetylornithine/N-succinyldiaminopimelate aminotransferase